MKIMNAQLQQAVEVLNRGGIVIFPTDTVYGIGCRLDNEKALERLFKIRNRPKEKAVLAVIDSLEMAKEYVEVSQEVEEKLIHKYWPGALTIVLPCKTKKVPGLARGGGNSLGLRQTNNTVLLKLIKGVGVPLIAPSANFAGEPTPKTFGEIDKKLLKMVDFAINLSSDGNLASTIIDCSEKPWKILRQGAVTIGS